MRFIKNLIIIFILIGCAAFFSMNSGIVEVNFFPKGLSIEFVAISLPLFVIMLFFMVVGFFLGTLSEYFRSYKYRKAARQKVEEVKSLSNEVKYLKNKTTSETEEILNLLK